jgi:uncharacterized protein
MPDELSFAPGQAVAEGQRLLDADRPFHAHEVFEAVWKAAPAAERELWRGLAQVAVGLTHVRRGNLKGAHALLTRAADRLTPYTRDHPYGLDLPGLLRDVHTLADRAAHGDLPPTAPLPIQLTTPKNTPKSCNRPPT